MVQDSGAQHSMDPAHDAGTNSKVEGAAETEGRNSFGTSEECVGEQRLRHFRSIMEPTTSSYAAEVECGNGGLSSLVMDTSSALS